MKKIYKYTLKSLGEIRLNMPNGAIIRKVAEQDGDICIWAEVNTGCAEVERRFEVFGTGQEMPTEILGARRSYLDTVFIDTPIVPFQLVFHVYERA